MPVPTIYLTVGCNGAYSVTNREWTRHGGQAANKC